ncbi:MAG: GNAT family N-acetyltransferase [Rhodobacterales bacterium]|nr:MAG: GNAT family N-acetyltransferase [Rhodobacterales bacterium]
MTSRDNFAALHTMLRRAFAYMEGRIDPPSSMANMSVEDLRNTSEASEIWVIEEADRPIASVTLTPTDSTLYLDKLATSPTHRQEGLARELLTLAENRAQALNLSSITLNTRVELVDNHATFHAMGFEYVGEATHKGFDHPTSLIYRKTL